jgi:hypothetical protein
MSIPVWLEKGNHTILVSYRIGTPTVPQVYQDFNGNYLKVDYYNTP